jgi:phage terminase large subunit-like protein
MEQTETRNAYVIKGEKTWAAAKAAYQAGGTARAVARHYGLTEAALKKRASRDKWRKRDLPDVPPPWPDLEGAPPAPGELRPALELRPEQQPPDGEWSTWLFLGGRGAGKTLAGAEWVAGRAEKTGRIALVGSTIHDVREVMVDGASGLRALPRYDGGERPVYEPSRKRLLWSNGAQAFAFSAEDPESLRGPQFGAAWADELCVWKAPEETLALLRMGLRLGRDPRLVVTTTPKPLAALRRLRAEPSCVETHAPTAANAANLSPAFLQGLQTLYGGTRRAAQELEGLLVEAEGALWRAEELERCRGALPPRFDRVVVGVDPPASATGDACGIVVAGRLGERGYVLADHTGSGLSPLGWAQRAAAAASEWRAAEVVAEVNQGGDMVRAVLAGAGVRCPVRTVHATAGKRARAEPVAALYEQGRITHCGAFPALEEELMAAGEGWGRNSPDRADALVWALTALLVEAPPRVEPRIRVL